MQYRKFGNTGFDVSLLGLGCMRLPFKDESDRGLGVDVDRAFEMIHYAVDNGINYFDAAFTYHNNECEAILGEALEQGGRRQKVKIATKLPFSFMPTQDDIRRNLETTLKKLRTDYIDVYLIHCIMQSSWGEIQKRKIFEEYEKFKAEGLIKHIGFSYHGQISTFKEVVERYPWDMCQVQQNLLDVNKEVTEESIFAAHKQGCAIVIMEPLRGGGLTQAPRPVAEIYNSFPVKRKPLEWAFRHLVNYPQISAILSGMSTLEQVKENIELFSKPDMKPGCLDNNEKAMIVKVREAYDSIVTIPCTGCNYCVPCPKKVDIPKIFRLYNDGNRFERFDQPKRSYMITRQGGGDVSKCVDCGICLTKCPQEIDIPKDLRVAHKVLDGWNE